MNLRLLMITTMEVANGNGSHATKDGAGGIIIITTISIAPIVVIICCRHHHRHYHCCPHQHRRPPHHHHWLAPDSTCDNGSHAITIDAGRDIFSMLTPVTLET